MDSGTPEGPSRRHRAGAGLDRRYWEALIAGVQHRASRLARRFHLDDQAAQDLAQEALTRYLGQVSANRTVHRPMAWLYAVMRRLCIDSLRGRPNAVSSRPELEVLDRAALALRKDPDAQDPASSALAWDLFLWAKMCVELFPPPCKQIAQLQCLYGYSRVEITTWLQTWRPVGDEEARRLLRRTHAMLRALGRGQHPRSVWPHGVSATRNVWMSTPPPPLEAPKS